MQRGLRELAFGQLHFVARGISDRPPEHDPLYLGQALAIAVVESNIRLASPNPGVRLTRLELIELGDWVRTTMDLCFRENIFYDVRETFDSSLALNSAETIRARLEEYLHPNLKRRIESMLAQIRGAGGWSPDSPQELQTLGNFLRIAWEGNTLAVLNYALDQRLIEEADLPSIGSRFEDARALFHQSLAAIGRDAKQMSRQDPEELLERNRILRRILSEVRDAYGDAHPLARGFEGVFKNSLEDSQVEAVDRVFELVEHYLTNRH